MTPMSSKTSKPGLEEPIAPPKEHRIRITLASRIVKSLETVYTRFLQSAKSKNVTVKGPVRMPTKVLRITTRKTPCGEGSKTWDRYELRIHKRVIDFKASAELVKEIVSHLFS